jgi:hypothetical protein
MYCIGLHPSDVSELVPKAIWQTTDNCVVFVYLPLKYMYWTNSSRIITIFMVW